MKKPRLYLYDRMELVLLTLLFMTSVLFTFTVGVHWGKNLGLLSAPSGAGSEAIGKIEGTDDNLPSREELDSKVAAAENAAIESLTRSLQEEVARTGIRLDVPRQVELPKQARSERAVKLTREKTETREEAPLEVAKREETAFAKKHDTSVKQLFTLQVGSYPTEEEASKKAKLLEMAGHEPVVRRIDIEGKGTWFRVTLGSFESSNEAEAYGKEQVSKQALDSYLVVKQAK